MRVSVCVQREQVRRLLPSSVQVGAVHSGKACPFAQGSGVSLLHANITARAIIVRKLQFQNNFRERDLRVNANVPQGT